MLTEYQLTNFKAFGETVTIPIRPITLIFGPNSSGKSSILQSLRLLKQSIENDQKFESITPKGRYIDTGGFYEFIHGHDELKEFSFKMIYGDLTKSMYPDGLWNSLWGYNPDEWKEEYEPDYEIFCDAFKKIVFNQLAISKSFRSDLAQQKIPFQNESILLGNDRLDLYYSRTAEEEGSYNQAHECIKMISAYIDEKAGVLELRKNFESQILEASKPSQDIKTISQNSLIEQIRAIDNYLKKYNMSGLDRFEKVYNIQAKELLEGTLSKIEYIPPLRDYPLRYYDLNEPSEYLNLHTNSENFNKANEWLQRLDTGCILDQIESWNVIYELSKTLVGIAPRIMNIGSKISSSIADVGFGISQLLPIITKSMALKNSTILIEQPEIHLHPKLQAEMGDLFISSALGEQKNTFLIETHSEHLLLRIMRRMREKSNNKLHKKALPVTPKDVAVLFVQPKGAASVVRQLELDEEGQLLDPWPGGFFEEGFRERFAEERG